MQKQISTAITKEVDSYTEFSKGTADGRFGNSRPVKRIQMSNAHGFFYFVVGASIVGDVEVAAP
jgi:hypothetical protein